MNRHLVSNRQSSRGRRFRLSGLKTTCLISSVREVSSVTRDVCDTWSSGDAAPPAAQFGDLIKQTATYNLRSAAVTSQPNLLCLICSTQRERVEGQCATAPPTETPRGQTGFQLKPAGNKVRLLTGGLSRGGSGRSSCGTGFQDDASKCR